MVSMFLLLLSLVVVESSESTSTLPAASGKHPVMIPYPETDCPTSDGAGDWPEAVFDNPTSTSDIASPFLFGDGSCKKFCDSCDNGNAFYVRGVCTESSIHMQFFTSATCESASMVEETTAADKHCDSHDVMGMDPTGADTYKYSIYAVCRKPWCLPWEFAMEDGILCYEDGLDTMEIVVPAIMVVGVLIIVICVPLCVIRLCCKACCSKPKKVAPAAPKQKKIDIENIARWTTEEMKAGCEAVAKDLKQKEKLVFHFTSKKTAEMIIAPTSKGLLASKGGQLGGGVSVCKNGPHELGWEQYGGGGWRETIGKALWGEKADEVLENGASADKLEICLAIKLNEDCYVNKKYFVPGRDDIVIIQEPLLSKKDAKGDEWYDRSHIIKCWELTPKKDDLKKAKSKASARDSTN